jgi:hypothetical protein
MIPSVSTSTIRYTLDQTRHEDTSNFRERILSRMPEAYGKVKTGTPLYDLIESVSEEISQMNKRQVLMMEQVMFFMGSLEGIDLALKKDVPADPESIINMVKSASMDIFNSQKTSLVSALEDRMKEKTETERSEFLEELRKT